MLPRNGTGTSTSTRSARRSGSAARSTTPTACSARGSRSCSSTRMPLSRRCTPERRLRGQAPHRSVVGLLARVVDPSDRPEAGLPRASGVQHDADARRHEPAAGHAPRRSDHRPLLRDGARGTAGTSRHGPHHWPGRHHRPEQQEGRSVDAVVLGAAPRQLAQVGNRAGRAGIVRLGDRSHLTVHLPCFRLLLAGRGRLLLLRRVRRGRTSHRRSTSSRSPSPGAPSRPAGPSSRTTAARPRSPTPPRPARPARPTADRSASTRGSARTTTARSATASTTRRRATTSAGVDQFATTTECDGAFGPDTTYCATQVP